jgi:hypothetical protein
MAAPRILNLWPAKRMEMHLRQWNLSRAEASNQMGGRGGAGRRGAAEGRDERAAATAAGVQAMPRRCQNPPQGSRPTAATAGAISGPHRHRNMTIATRCSISSACLGAALGVCIGAVPRAHCASGCNPRTPSLGSPRGRSRGSSNCSRTPLDVSLPQPTSCRSLLDAVPPGPSAVRLLLLPLPSSPLVSPWRF